MFSICKQSHPATAVEFSIRCHFFNNFEKSLITGGANILKVYRIVPDVEPNSKEKFSGWFMASNHLKNSNNCYFS